MTIRMYDLAGADDRRRFSPYCWRVTMALAHKGLDFEAVPWRFTDKDAIAFSGQARVPVLVDGDRQVHDSWTIAEYLDETYPDRPLFDSEAAKGEALFIKHWTERVVHPGIARQVVADIPALLHENDVEYFVTSREKAYGMTLEEVVADADATLPAFQTSLAPLRETVKVNAFIGGAAPTYADYIVFGAFQWARCCSPRRLLAADDPVHAWRGRMLALHAGLAGKAVGYEA